MLTHSNFDQNILQNEVSYYSVKWPYYIVLHHGRYTLFSFIFFKSMLPGDQFQFKKEIEKRDAYLLKNEAAPLLNTDIIYLYRIQ